MGAVVFIDAGSLWGMLRNFFFGLFGLSAFILPVFILFVSIVSAIGKDSRKYKIKVTESFIIFVLLVSFLHIVNSQPELTYGEQISEAYKVFKEYDGTGMHYGYGVFGALLGGLPLLMTAGNKLAAGIVVVLILLALLMLFTGTTVLKLISSLKKPAEAAAEYAEEKIGDFKDTYETVSEDIHERRARNAAKRRKESKHQIELDIPIDDEIPADKGVEPIIDTTPAPVEEDIELLGSFEEEPPMDVQALDELFATKTVAEAHFDEVVEAFEEETQEEVSEDAVVEDEEPEADDKEPAVPEIIYELPPLDCLDKPKLNSNSGSAEELRQRGETIVKTLKSFGVGTRIVDICQSPSVTRFELQPDPGVKISKITALSDDIAMNLAAYGVRIEAPIPNKNAVGIEVPNAEKAMVTLREILESPSFQNSKSRLNVALGRDIQGEATCADLAKMPHLLVAGTTGSGKSVCLNTMIVSLLYNAKPDEVKLIMIDPKKVEFTVYRSIPHLLVPVVADPRKAAGALSWAVAEMDKRYALFAEKGVRNLQGYNNYALSEGIPKMPQIVIIIDELSDLMMAASNEVEDSICRLAQKARAAGMHLIVATQRPSVDVITGLIKANIPSRIAFAVKSQIDSRTIIDTQGAEKLLGNGDMLYCPVGLSKPVRVQGSYVSDDEIERVIDFVTSQGEVKYDDAVMQEIELKAAQDGKKKASAVDTDNVGSGGDYDDEMFPKAVEVVVEAGMASTTLLQRKLKLGYARAARIVDELSEKGIIGPFEGSKPRKVLITKEQWYQMQANSSTTAPKQLSVDDIELPNATKEEVKVTDEPNYFGSAVNNANYDVEE
ncbi:MAG: DNA translocase FtsK [Clostridia bacterium]|nr:DNA translocase FtsK [Clostridia bacterium]